MFDAFMSCDTFDSLPSHFSLLVRVLSTCCVAFFDVWRKHWRARAELWNAFEVELLNVKNNKSNSNNQHICDCDAYASNRQRWRCFKPSRHSTALEGTKADTWWMDCCSYWCCSFKLLTQHSAMASLINSQFSWHSNILLLFGLRMSFTLIRFQTVEMCSTTEIKFPQKILLTQIH